MCRSVESHKGLAAAMQLYARTPHREPARHKPERTPTPHSSRLPHLHQLPVVQPPMQLLLAQLRVLGCGVLDKDLAVVGDLRAGRKQARCSRNGMDTLHPFHVRGLLCHGPPPILFNLHTHATKLTLAVSQQFPSCQAVTPSSCCSTCAFTAKHHNQQAPSAATGTQRHATTCQAHSSPARKQQRASGSTRTLHSNTEALQQNLQP